MVPVDTVTRWVVTDRGAVEEPPEVATRVTTTPAAAASTTARPTSTWLRVGRRLRRVGGTSWAGGFLRDIGLDRCPNRVALRRLSGPLHVVRNHAISQASQPESNFAVTCGFL